MHDGDGDVDADADADAGAGTADADDAGDADADDDGNGGTQWRGRWRCAMLRPVAMCDGDADTDARCAVATRESDAAADVEVLALPLTVASSRAGHLQQSLGASAQRQGVGWCDLRKREKHGGSDADARAAGHLRLLLLQMLTPYWAAVVAASAGVTAAA